LVRNEYIGAILVAFGTMGLAVSIGGLFIYLSGRR